MRSTKSFDTLSAPLDEVVDVMSAGTGDVSALATEQSGLVISVDDRKQDASEVPLLRGVVLRAFDGQGFVEFAADGARRTELLGAARRLARVAARAGGRWEPSRGHFETGCEIDPEDVTTEDKFARVRELHAKVRALHQKAVNARATYRETVTLQRFRSPDRDLVQRIVRVVATAILFVAEDGRTEYAYAPHGGTEGVELLHFTGGELERIRETASAMLHAERIEPGTYDIVTSQEASGLIAHEAFGHGVEMDLYPKERARSQLYLGQRVASSLTTMYDDPSVPGAYGSFFFDDEGHLAQRTTIIRDGIYVGGLADESASVALGYPATPNGRRESYRRKAYARMSNTFFAADGKTVEQLIAGIDRGIYLDRGSSGMEDPKSWGIQVTMRDAREIRGGRLTDRYFKEVGVTGYVPDVLGSISAVADDLSFDAGMCGKGHKEFVPVSSGGPHLRLVARLS
ncbi:MAG TPA: TldD/PmbA family protein [Candidatus Limnocylindria bacterium]|nr:TldD/PmbA family protein [Candidatus Limnocylindria bacterium]